MSKETSFFHDISTSKQPQALTSRSHQGSPARHTEQPVVCTPNNSPFGQVARSGPRRAVPSPNWPLGEIKRRSSAEAPAVEIGVSIRWDLSFGSARRHCCCHLRCRRRENPSFWLCATTDSTSDSLLLHAPLLHTYAHQKRASTLQQPRSQFEAPHWIHRSARSGTSSVKDLGMLTDHGSVLAETQRQIASK
jgi:hypothetical protein